MANGATPLAIIADRSRGPPYPRHSTFCLIASSTVPSCVSSPCNWANPSGGKSAVVRASGAVHSRAAARSSGASASCAAPRHRCCRWRTFLLYSTHFKGVASSSFLVLMAKFHPARSSDGQNQFLMVKTPKCQILYEIFSGGKRAGNFSEILRIRALKDQTANF